MQRRFRWAAAACGMLAAVTLGHAGAAVAAPGAPAAPAAPGATAPPDVRNQFIIVFKDQAVTSADASSAAVARARAQGITVTREYRHAIKGYSAKLNPAQLASVRADPQVAFVEADQVVRANDLQADSRERAASWGLDRVDQHVGPLDGAYNYRSTGNGVTTYILDSGIRTTHQEFGGRASGGFTAINDGWGTNDCYGHGTHVAGTVGGARYGVAKLTRLVSVRVLDCGGWGTWSGVISGVDWVTANHAANSVANMSLGGGGSTALDQAVTRSINAGTTYAVSAGNSNDNACNYSPARVPGAITVGATTSADSRDTIYSNFGTCLDVFAPGTDITSAWNNSDSATNTISGTSMASPHAAGVAALYKQRHASATPSLVRDSIVKVATRNVVANAGAGSPNALLFSMGTGF